MTTLLVRSVLVLSIVGSGAVASSARAAEAPPTGTDKEARNLFAQGQVHYSLGEYEQAISEFRRAYELTSAPGLLFNIAQAHRLAGQCPQALEVYRHFTRLLPDSGYRAEADAHIAALVVRCGTARPAVPPSAPARAAAVDVAAAPALQLSRPVAPPEPPRWSTRRRTAAALLAGGVAAGVAAGVVYWWNGGRYDDWSAEDQRLMAASGTSPDVSLAAQQRNDALLRSIQHADTVDLALAGLSIAAVVTSAVLAVAF